MAAGPTCKRLIDEIADKARALQVDGRPVIDRIYRRDELYSGNFLATAPDLVFVPHRGFDLKGTLSQQTTAGRSVLTGMHTQDDALLYVNRPVTKAGKASILDLAPTVLLVAGGDAAEAPRRRRSRRLASGASPRSGAGCARRR